MDAAELRYDDLVDRIEVLYNDQRYHAAVELLDAESTGLEVWAAELAHLKACLLGAAGDAEAALRVLQEASTAGAWWRPEILEDDDLAALRDRREFLELVGVSKARLTDEPVRPLITLPPGRAWGRPESASTGAAPVAGTEPVADAGPVPRTGPVADAGAVAGRVAGAGAVAGRVAGAGAVAGIVVALHGAGQRAEHARRDWSGVLELGYALVCVQSSYRMSPMYRTWPDPEQARADIARALTELPAHGLPIVAAGFSAGGRVALDWALTEQPAPVAGVLAVAPALRHLPERRRPEHQRPLSPATIWIGTDDDLLDVVDAASGPLTAAGLTIERIPRLGHAFPDDFAARLSTVL